MLCRNLLSFVLATALVMSASPAWAQWPPDGLPVQSTTFLELEPQIVSDGVGGAIIAWTDVSNLVDADIFVQRITEEGVTLWPVGGAPACTTSGDQYFPEVVTDGAGGMILVWTDDRNSVSNIYAQRINASGTALWTTNGVPICSDASGQVLSSVVPDGAGGAIVAWGDFRGTDEDIYAQRVDSNGNVLWTADGEAICTATTSQQNPALLSDGAGGAYIAWADRRVDVYSDLYAQRIAANGDTAWAADGIPINTEVFGVLSIHIVTDGAGGAIMVWGDVRAGNVDVYAQRVDSFGATAWTTNGVPVVMGSHSEDEPAAVSDGAGGAIVVWQDQRLGTGQTDVYAQRINGSGATQWTSGGVAVCAAADIQFEVDVQSDGVGGAMVTWRDSRLTSNDDVYAQRIDATGSSLWATNGVQLTGATDDQVSPRLAVTGAGTAIVAWEDQRKTFDDPDVYAQRIEDGNLGFPTPSILSINDVPGDQGGWVRMHYAGSDWDAAGAPTPIATYGVWRRIDGALAFTIMQSAVGADADASVVASSLDPDIIARDIPLVESEGRFLARPDDEPQAASFPPGTWEFLSSVPAVQQSEYYVLCPTFRDSSDTGTNEAVFVLTAHTTTPSLWYITDPDSGHSIDNLAPAAPQGLDGEFQVNPDGLNLTWQANTENDLSHYAVYRGLTSDFIPAPGNRIGTPTAPTFLDGEWASDSGYYYKVAAWDVNANEGPYAVLTPELIVGVGDQVPQATFLEQNVPNPFNPTTTITFGLREPAHVTLTIHDITGRPVRTLVNRRYRAGIVAKVWDGRNDSGSIVASGVYFYRLVAGEASLTRRMVFLK